MSGSYHKHQILVTEIMCELSKNKNIRVWSNQTGMGQAYNSERFVRYGLEGSADIIGIIGPHGKFLAIEVKTGNSKQSAAQLNFQKMILDRGGLYILARSVLEATQGVATARTASD